MDDGAEERRRRRANWPIRRFTLGEEPEFDDRGLDSVAARVAAAWAMTRAIFEVAGEPIEPPYTRATMPGRITRPDD